MFVTFFLIFFLVLGIVGYVGWFFSEVRTFISMVGSLCCGFTMVTCGFLLYMHWFRGLEFL